VTIAADETVRHRSSDLPVHRRPRIASTLFLLFTAVLPRTASAQASPRCSDEEFRQLDFWVGSWKVKDRDGHVVGESTVSSRLERCALVEEWSSDGSRGISINGFDKPTGVWRQMWVDTSGAVLRIAGAWEGDRMVLSGDRVGSDGKTRRLRVTLIPGPDATLRQLQERSDDDGHSWTVIFDGTYVKKGS